MLFHAWLTKRFWYIHVPNKISTLLYSVTGEGAWRLVIPAPHPTKAYAYRPGVWRPTMVTGGKPISFVMQRGKASKTGSTKTPQHTHAILFLGFLMERWILKLGKPYLGSAIIKRNRYLWRIRNDVFANKIGALLELHQTHVRIISLVPGKGIKGQSPDGFGGFSLLWMWQFNPQPWLFLWLLLVILKDLHVVCLSGLEQ